MENGTCGASHKKNRDGKRHGKHDLHSVKEKRHGQTVMEKASRKVAHAMRHGKNITSQLQSIDSKFVNIIVHVFAFFEIAVLICVVFYATLLAILDLTMFSCMN